jgi:hypothetical protein
MRFFVSETSSLETSAKAAVAAALLLSASLLPVAAVAAGGVIADHNSVTQFGLIPPSVVEAIGADYNIYYVHTSHGSQIVTGLTVVYNGDNLYDPPHFYEYGDDLGHNGDTSWVPATRAYLDAHPECNVAMFSWCGGCSDNTEEGIDIYLAKMEELEDDYPNVLFVYMTGHLDGSGPEENLYARNNQIRDYCSAHGKVLFDFADIESYDPDGTYYPYESDECGWCYDWCATHPDCPSCGCAHSHCFNCYQKGKAWWWMMARVSGWTGGDCCGVYTAGYTGNTNCSPDGVLNLADITVLIDRAYVTAYPLCCEPNGNTNGDPGGLINLADITRLIDNVYVSGAQTAPCP